MRKSVVMYDPAFSPDGLAIAFATTQFGYFSEIVLMNPDGTGIRRVGGGTVGYQPSFSVLNMARATFVYKPADNHDTDGDSNGSAITVPRQ